MMIKMISVFFCIAAVFVSAQRNGIGTIPFSVKEVSAVSDLLDGDLLTFEKANFKNVSNEIENYDIIHFSLHAETDEDNPLLSKFDLYGDKDLFLSDIYSMNLSAKLAVLSGCGTGAGKFFTGEGVMSFARAFRFAECPSVVMTRWAVDDYTTSEIIENFYKNLFAGDAKDIAMRKAKLKYLAKSNRKSAAPVFWSAPSVSGNVSKLNFEEKKNITYPIILGISLAVLIGIFLTVKKKRLTAD